MLCGAGCGQSDPGLFLLSLVLEPTSLGLSWGKKKIISLILKFEKRFSLLGAHSILIRRRNTPRLKELGHELALFSEAFPVDSAKCWFPLYFS